MREYIVDPILPVGEIHLIAGSSGAGKTRFILQALKQWHQGKPFLGYKSNPCPFIYVSCDRSAASVEETLETLDLSPSDIPFIDGRGFVRHGTESFNELFKEVNRTYPEARLLVVESIGQLVPTKGQHLDYYQATGRFLIDLSNHISKRGLTILGTVHCPKQRKNAELADPRQFVLGSVAWGAFAETLIVIARNSPEDPADRGRKLWLLPRNAPEETYDFEVNHRGQFVEIPSKEKIDAFERLTVWLGAFDGQDFDVEAMMSKAEQLGISRRTVYRWVSKVAAEGLLVKVRRGIYRKAQLQ